MAPEKFDEKSQVSQVHDENVFFCARVCESALKNISGKFFFFAILKPALIFIRKKL